ncbi:tetratricopeptide repeat domain-containing protein PYG7, chloroplastic [Selaginella moellendorffii]|uniref:tetratricopeptide repeat domain-containing protein PYG7, chloroplastic n=1 Tax=Selaginella moellendorffii TaxID=88036 RepID=UPI000D1CD4FE|nr:tetratricopeptide repeat domain-containing protein PYG7, chloroplastic [Selaginella moellendorffii]|eukprot:XP_002992853.2 tetratricopeptide repeat domain-containing protein PYG7, chloroplastic [Selaginella moellendorffii]
MACSSSGASLLGLRGSLDEAASIRSSVCAQRRRFCAKPRRVGKFCEARCLVDSSPNLRIAQNLVTFAPLLQTGVAHAAGNRSVGEISVSLAETGFQYAYLGGVLLLLGGGGFFVIRQILVRRELEMAAKELLERVRTSQATPVEYYELGAVMLRKKLYPVARKYLEQAIKKWEDDEQELAQVYNALGFAYFSENKVEQAISHYEKAVTLSPGYTVAWNNLGSSYEKRKDWKRALKAYEQTLQFDPRNKVALSCQKYVKDKVELYRGIPSKFD